MSYLEKLVISGIRSFSPDRQEGINFETPITLIVGQNGSGKTTVIECLKASIIGDLPPNSKCGQYFIHDPKLRDAAEVKGQIRLIFRDYQNEKKIQVVRSFQLSQIKSRNPDKDFGEIKAQFKVLESILQTKDEISGEITSISHKCADINSQVPILFGVSSSVIENVLFCHQEDSNWPLQEMSKVKKKFDDLFGSTRYSKALECMIKLKNDYSKRIKEMSLQNTSIKEKIVFVEDLIKKKQECLYKKEEINEKICILDFKLKTLLEEKELKEKIRENLENLFIDISSETKLANLHLKDIHELELELESLNYKNIVNLIEPESLIFEQKKLEDLKIQLDDIQKEIFNIQDQVEIINESSISEFKTRFYELNAKLCEIKDKELTLELKTFISSCQEMLKEKLIRYKELNWNIGYKYISEIKFTEADLLSESLKELKKDLTFKLKEKENLLILIEDKKNERASFQKNLDKINFQISEKKNIQFEINNLNLKIEDGKENLIEKNNSNSKKNFSDFNFTNAQQLLDLYEITYELGVLYGEFSILEKIEESVLFKNNEFIINDIIPNFQETIKLKKEQYIFKKPDVTSLWEDFRNFVNSDLFKTESTNFYLNSLKAQRSFLNEKIKIYEDLEIQKINLEDKLSKFEIHLKELENNIRRIELECQELIDKIQSTKIKKHALEIEFNKKKDYLNKMINSIKEDFEYLFTNNDFKSLNDRNINNQKIQSLKFKRDEERQIREKLKEQNELIEISKKMISLKRKKEKYDSSISIVNEKQIIINNLLDLECKQVLNNTSYMIEVEEKHQLFKEKLNSIREEVENTMCELSRLKGESKVNEDWLIKIDKDLQNQTNIDSLIGKYSKGVFEQTLLTSYVKDIEKYHSSLQKALMRFHVDKMKEINRTIKELWNVTYKGQDIDYIAIKSDAEDDKDTKLDLEKANFKSFSTKSFNYRVVMIQNGVELDMKGRCSAGQKVLACIIIRLALAESFCTNCGILALDEPTTNLDRFNMEGLAEALSYLIKFRKQQKNFQLIIITHDERFVRIMAQSQQCDHFYQISKDEQGYSTIRQMDFYGY